MCDAISRSAVLEGAENIDWYHVNQNGKLVSGSTSDDVSYVKYDDVVHMLKNAPSFDVALVEHGDDSVFLHVNNIGEWNSRIILLEEGSHNCAVYYQDDDDESVTHAKWIRDDLGNTRCSNCYTRLPFRHCYDEEDGYEWDDEIGETPWCMFCGARMDGEENAAD